MNDEDLFAIPPSGPAHARRTDPDTSYRAAREVTPHTDNIRAEVERWARGRGPEGFIDEELSAAFDASDSSSYRTRRGELTQAGVILDTGRRRPNTNMRQCIVWMHRDHRGRTPEPEQPLTTRELLLRHANRLAEDGAWMHKQGWVGAAANMIETADLIKTTLGRTAAPENTTGTTD